MTNTLSYSYHTAGLTGELGATTAQIKGMPTMVQKSTVGSGLTTAWLISVTFYDHNLHPIQTQSNNLLYTTGGQNAVTDYKTNVLDFTGMPLVSLTSKTTSSTVTSKVQTTLTYDQAHRITAVDQSYNGLSTVHVAQYVYNELGQLIQKKLGETSTTWLQLVDFRYNIRGQLTSINNSTLTDNGQTDDDPAPVFGMTLLYDQRDSLLGNTVYHSGRLSAVKWMSKDGSNNSSYERAYTYNYDAADRYTAANYAERNGSGSFNFTHGWDEQITAYDENGNIKKLKRNATTQGSGTYTPVDNLTYTYQTNNANQLYTVTDSTNNQTGFGIQTGGSASGHYVYDANGNLTSDPYKYLTIGYNVINKTDKITMSGYTGRFEYYVYDATGTVMEKQQWDGGALVHTTVYMDGFVYIDGTISYITTPEGRADYNGSTFTNEYIITDQQGNARVSFNNTGTLGAREVIQENSYYGFGMVMPGSTVGLPTTPNKNLYNGQSEWQNDYSNMPDYYQTPGRNYDAEIGRFISQDPMPESASDMSTYHYAGDNPIMMNDPSGNHFTTTLNNLNPQYNSNYYTLNATTSQSEQIANDMSNEAEGNFGMGYEEGGAYAGFWGTVVSAANDILTGINNNKNFTAAGIDFQNVNTLINIAFSPAGTYDMSFNNGGITLTEVNDSPAPADDETYMLNNTPKMSNDMNEPSGSNIWGGGSQMYQESNRVEGNGIYYQGAIYAQAVNISGYNFQSYRWVSKVTTHPNFVQDGWRILVNPINDGLRDRFGNNVNDPFYYAPGTQYMYGNWTLFKDQPGVPAWKYDFYSFSAETTLYGLTNGILTPIVTFNWGYSIQWGVVTLAPITTTYYKQ